MRPFDSHRHQDNCAPGDTGVVVRFRRWRDPELSIIRFPLGRVNSAHERDQSNPPPFHVWIAQALHFLMLAGLAVALRWERIGGVVVGVTGLLFLVRAGANFPVFYAITLLPIGILVISRWAICLVLRPRTWHLQMSRRRRAT
jgi:hypothetical protein